MKILHIISFTWITLFLIWGCEGSFTQIVNVDRSGIETKGVVFSLLSNTDGRDSAFFSQSYKREKNGMDQYNRIYISNSSQSAQPQNMFYGGQVKIQSKNEELAIKYYDQQTVNPNADPFYAVLSSFQPGKTYYLSAEFGGQHTGPDEMKWSSVSAADTMPMPVDIQIENADIAHSDLKGSESEGYMDIKIKDEPYRFNAYQIEVSVIQEVVKENGHVTQIIIPATVEGSEDRINSEVFGTYHLNLVTQAAFNRQGQRRVNFTFSSNHASFNKQKPVLLMIRLSNLSDNYQEFLNSSRQYYANGDNPFSEPSEIYSNIDNGYGIFAFSTRSFAQVDVE